MSTKSAFQKFQARRQHITDYTKIVEVLEEVGIYNHDQLEPYVEIFVYRSAEGDLINYIYPLNGNYAVDIFNGGEEGTLEECERAVFEALDEEQKDTF